MEFEGVVYKILPATGGTSARGEWKKQEVIFELPQEFSRKVCVVFFNKESDVARLKEGSTYIVSVNIESREYNGRWYNDIRAWKVERGVAPFAAAPSEAAPQINAPKVAAPDFSSQNDNDELPF